MYYNDRNIVFHKNSEAFFNYIDTPSLNQLIRYDWFIRNISNLSIFEELDRVWIWASELQQNAKVSIKNPSSSNLVEVNSITWNQFQGYKGNGTTMYLNLKYNPNSSAVKATVDSTGVHIYSRTNNTSGNNDFGCTDGTTTTIQLYGKQSDGRIHGNLNNTSLFNDLTSTSDGLLSIVRSGKNLTNLYRNGQSMAVNTTSSVSAPNYDMYAAARNTAGTATGFNNREYSAFFIGSSNLDITKLYNAIQGYMTLCNTKV